MNCKNHSPTDGSTTKFFSFPKEDNMCAGGLPMACTRCTIIEVSKAILMTLAILTVSYMRDRTARDDTVPFQPYGVFALRSLYTSYIEDQ